MPRHRFGDACQVGLGRALARKVGRRDIEVVGKIADARVVGGGLIARDIGHDVVLDEVGEKVVGVAGHGDRAGLARGAGGEGASDAGRDRRLNLVEVAARKAALDASRVDLGEQADGVQHLCGQRLSPAHAAQTGRDEEPPPEAVAVILAGDGGKGFERALDDPLGADVDPRAGGHLAEHGQALGLEAVEFVQGGPGRHEQAVGDEHARRLGRRREDRDGLSGLDQERLVVAQRLERGDDGVKGRPRAGGSTAPAVDDEVVRALRDVGIEVVHEHPQGRLLRPAAAVQGPAMVGADRAGPRLGKGHLGHRFLSSALAQGFPAVPRAPCLCPLEHGTLG